MLFKQVFQVLIRGHEPTMYDEVLPGDDEYKKTKERGWGAIP